MVPIISCFFGKRKRFSFFSPFQRRLFAQKNGGERISAGKRNAGMARASGGAPSPEGERRGRPLEGNRLFSPADNPASKLPGEGGVPAGHPGTPGRVPKPSGADGNRVRPRTAVFKVSSARSEQSAKRRPGLSPRPLKRMQRAPPLLTEDVSPPSTPHGTMPPRPCAQGWRNAPNHAAVRRASASKRCAVPAGGLSPPRSVPQNPGGTGWHRERRSVC